MVRAYVLITTTAGRALAVVDHLDDQSGVIQCDAITGEYDVIALVEAPDIAAIGRLIVEQVQGASGVLKTVTCLAVQ